MTEFNPLAGALLAGAVTQQQSADAKRSQIRRAQLLRSNSATPTDTFEPHVESAEELHPADDREKKNPNQRNPQKPKRPDGSNELDEHEHIDLCG